MRKMILRLRHGFFDGGIATEVPTLTTSSWEHNNLLLEEYESQTRHKGHLVSRAVDSRRGGCYTGVSQQFNRGALPGISRTIKCDNSASVCVEDNRMKRYRIRKLTPKECHRAMGVADSDFEKMAGAGISDSQLYKLAGNSIVVPVLEGIFFQMFSNNAVGGNTLFG